MQPHKTSDAHSPNPQRTETLKNPKIFLRKFSKPSKHRSSEESKTPRFTQISSKTFFPKCFHTKLLTTPNKCHPYKCTLNSYHICNDKIYHALLTPITLVSSYAFTSFLAFLSIVRHFNCLQWPPMPTLLFQSAFNTLFIMSNGATNGIIRRIDFPDHRRAI